MSHWSLSSADRRRSAFRAAWMSYLILLMLPFAVLGIASWSYAGTPVRPRTPDGETRWLLLTMGYVLVGVPAAFFYRRHLSAAHARGDVVAPREYLAGMLAVWLALEVGMILPIAGCYVTGSFLPGLLPALVAFVFFITLWPNGDMLTSHAGDSDDPEIHQASR